jgi:hypothetical protein
MSNAEGTFGSGSGWLGQDPVTGFFLAMRDVWLANALKQNPAAPPVADQPSLGPTTRLSPPGRNDAAAAELLLPIGHAMMIAANRSVSYWLGLAQILESHQARLVQIAGLQATDAGKAGSERLVAADELRALLREVGDLATREARLLQNDLNTLDESLAQTLQQPDLSGSYRRRWRSKL